ncbi:hypothetical protein GALMADRAFT_247181 [Galerina marginata CBS 339.88]|uniref:Uncharacterized protein n=1 Tax=Galerina marginata (strain CBS 339.88) TaxID=685588 RepID=A0A067T7W7_GALM3|nr:hypothetical protein GALMADRAFT_247181 [Galerina marginata CBS 339.88]
MHDYLTFDLSIILAVLAIFILCGDPIRLKTNFVATSTIDRKKNSESEAKYSPHVRKLENRSSKSQSRQR